MRYFQQPIGAVFAFDPDVVVTETNGVSSFKTAAGVPLPNLPTDLTPCPGNRPPGPTLARARATVIVTAKAACAAAIGAGFKSSALGSAYSYGSQDADQANIAVAAIVGGTLWCANSSDDWSFTAHTVVQAQQVRADLWTHIQSCQTKYADLLRQIAAATTVEAVRGVQW